MDWYVLKDPCLAQRIVKESKVIVSLNVSVGTVPEEKFILQDEECQDAIRRYTLNVHNTKPSVVSVHDATRDRFAGIYLCDDNQPIKNAEDKRLPELIETIQLIGFSFQGVQLNE